MEWHDVLKQDELWAGELIPAKVAGKAIFVTNIGGEIKAYEDRCPHQLNTLSDGTFDGHTLMCKTHRWRFDLATGCGINPSSSRLFAVPVRTHDGRIQVSLDTQQP